MTEASSSDLKKLRSPLYGAMDRIPGGTMVIPLIAGAIVGTTAPDFLELGSFTTALFATPMPLMALVIFATGMQITPRSIGPVAGTTGAILLGKTLVPGSIVVALGFLVGLDGFLGISILALLATFDNSNGGIWLAFTGKYGTKNDRGAYVASAVNDGPFFTMIFIGTAGLGSIPLDAFAAAIIPLILGIIVGNIDHRWTEIMRPVPNIVIPFFAFGLGTGIDISAVLTGGLTGIVLGLLVTPITGGTTYLAYRFLLRRGKRSGLAFVAGTTAGNSIVTPAIIAAADPRFEKYVDVATVQVATAVLISAITAPMIAAWVMKRNGTLSNPDEDEPDLRGNPLPHAARPQPADEDFVGPSGEQVEPDRSHEEDQSARHSEDPDV
ncbi:MULTISPECIES: 2-keto-3-deoxygluconate permease [unclassified Brachybacterium]|uniref:2-keto-3-deoxygluconate permease n=1 Tax=unclassified Brachybacterium TaxID=2623841 RepID=UPI00403320DD